MRPPRLADGSMQPRRPRRAQLDHRAARRHLDQCTTSLSLDGGQRLGTATTAPFTVLPATATGQRAAYDTGAPDDTSDCACATNEQQTKQQHNGVCDVKA
jgi:hypothetical protein